MFEVADFWDVSKELHMEIVTVESGGRRSATFETRGSGIYLPLVKVWL
jgi:hypothetical protein